MTPAHRRYLAVEAAISAGINAAISFVFALLAFHGLALVPARSLILDALPQSFMVTLMACVVPSLLTRRRLRAGTVAPLSPPFVALPRHLALRALLLAITVAVVAVGVQAAVLSFAGIVAMKLWPVLVSKPIYGAVLGAAITMLSIRAVLGSDHPTS